MNVNTRSRNPRQDGIPPPCLSKDHVTVHAESEGAAEGGNLMNLTASYTLSMLMRVLTRLLNEDRTADLFTDLLDNKDSFLKHRPQKMWA